MEKTMTKVLREALELFGDALVLGMMFGMFIAFYIVTP